VAGAFSIHGVVVTGAGRAPVRVGSYGHVSSRQVINVAPSRDQGADGAYPLLKAPRQGDWLPGPILGRGARLKG
jgi:hypothetical protein